MNTWTQIFSSNTPAARDRLSLAAAYPRGVYLYGGGTYGGGSRTNVASTLAHNAQ